MNHSINRLSVSFSLAGVSAALAGVLAVAVPAQVPDGWAVASRFRDANQPTLPGGLTILHTDRAGLSMEVRGLGPDLTGSSAQFQINGASSVLVRPTDGALVVGEHVTGITASVDIHLITLNGIQVAQDRLFNVGQVTSPIGYGWIDQMAWLPDGRVAYTLRGQFFNTMLPAGSTVGALDLATGQLGPLVTNLPGTPNALAISPNGSTLYVGLFGSGSSRILAVPTAGGTPRPSPPFPGTILQLATDNDGTLLAGFSRAPDDLLRIDPATWATMPIPGMGNVNALTVDSVTGNAIAYGFVNGAEALTVIEPSGALRPLVGIGPAESIPSGLAVAASMATYGAASPSQNLHAWEIAPNPGGAPAIGNMAFGLTIDTSPGTAPGVLVVGTRPGSLPLAPGRILRVDPSSVAALFYLPPAATNTLAMPIPADSAFLGLRLFAQSLHLEGNAIAASEGLRLTVF